MSDGLLGRVKNVKTYKPNIYVYKCIYEPLNGRLAGTSTNLADDLNYLWRLYIDTVLGLSNSNYTVYTIVHISHATAPSNTPPMDRSHVVSYTYLIFQDGAFIPCFASGGGKPASGLNNLKYGPTLENMWIINFFPSTQTASSSVTSTTQYCTYPMPLRLLGNSQIIGELATSVNLTSPVPLVELYGAYGIRPSAEFVNDPSWYLGYRYTFDELGISSYDFGIQFVMENIMVFPASDNYTPPGTGVTSSTATLDPASKTFYQNVKSGTKVIAENDAAETIVLVNEIMADPASVNLKHLMKQSPLLFIKYGEYILLIYRYALTRSLESVNNR